MLMLAWTSASLPGFNFPSGNNVYHVPIVLHYASSAEGPHDAFTRSLAHFVSGVWPALGLIANERNVYWVFLCAQLATRLVFVAGFYALLRCFSLSRLVALALTGFAAFAPIFRGDSAVGRGDILSTFFDHSEVAVALGPVCWALLLRGRWTAGAATIGLMFDANAFVGAWNAVAAITALVTSGISLNRAARQIAICALAFGATALPVMLWILQTVSRPRPAFSFGDYLRLYYPFHTFIDVQWSSAARYLAWAVAAGVAVRAEWSDMQSREVRTLVALLAAFVAIFLIAIPLPYVTDEPLLLELYPLRADSFVNLLTGILLLSWAGKWMMSDQRRDTAPLAVAVSFLAGNMIAALLILRLRSVASERPPRSIDWALGVAMCLLLVSGNPPALGTGAVLSKLIFCSIALCAAFADRSPEGAAFGTIAAALACAMLPALPAYPWPLVGLAIVVAVGVAGYSWAGPLAIVEMLWAVFWSIHVGDQLAALTIVVLGVVAIALRLRGGNAIRRLARWATTPLPLLIAIAIIGLARGAYAVAQSSLADPRENDEAKSTAQFWARAHVPPDQSLLIVDPAEVEGFQTLSRRPVWVDAQVGAAVMWEPSYFEQWRTRIQALEHCKDASCYAALARSNGIAWVVAPRGRLADARSGGLDLKFRNGLYEIYYLGDGAVRSQRVPLSPISPCAAPRSPPAARCRE
jgi:hypothetical protein